MTSPALKRILFVAENVTDDQVTRLVSLARSLPEDRYEVAFSSAQLEERWFHGTSVKTYGLYSLPREQILRSVAAGRQAYDLPELQR